MANLGVSLPGLEMSNPLMLASGIQGGNAAALHRVAATACGGLVSKSIGPEPREMYPGPVCVEAAEGVVLNAMGLPNPGADAFAELLQAETFSKPLLISIFGGDAEEYALVAQKLVAAGAGSLELNLSCPHQKPGSRALIIGQQPELIQEVVSAVRDAVDVPLYAKLSPNTTSIVDDATAAFKGGADGLSLINTISALEVDPHGVDHRLDHVVDVDFLAVLELAHLSEHLGHHELELAPDLIYKESVALKCRSVVVGVAFGHVPLADDAPVRLVVVRSEIPLVVGVGLRFFGLKLPAIVVVVKQWTVTLPRL